MAAITRAASALASSSSPAWACSAPQHGGARRRPRHVRTRRCQHGVRRPVRRAHQASITQPVNNHTVPFAVPPTRPPAQRQSGQAETPGHEAEALGEGQQRRAGEQQPVMGQQLQRQPLAPCRDTLRRRQGVLGALDQPAERHAARARRLAPAALHARLHEPDEVVVDRGVRATAPSASRRSARAATAPPHRSPDTSGSAAGTARSSRTPPARRRRGRSGDEVLTTDCDIAPHRIDRLTV